MNIVSLFDGISCGRVALERAGIFVDKYYAAEIDKYAIKISEKNYPDIIRLGDVTKWKEWEIDWSSIDLIFAGFPCQSWSLAGKQLGDRDERGKLFWVMLDIISHARKVNPKVDFLMENVKMKKEFEDYITSHTEKALGTVYKTLINSALVSAQNRKRFYWTSFPVSQPEDKGILLKDIVHENIDCEVSACMKDKAYTLTASYNGAVAWNSYERKQRTMLFEGLEEYIVPFEQTLKILEKEVAKGKVGYFRKDSQANRVYYIHDKAVTLCGEAEGGAGKMGQYLFGDVLYDKKPNRSATQGYHLCLENDKSTTLTSQGGGIAGKSALFGCLSPDRVDKRQNGQRFNTGQKFYTLTAQDRHGVLVEGYIRKLTPIECERLQTLEDRYTECGGVSSTQRYKALGNGWTVDVIAHILKALPEIKALEEFNDI